MQLKSPKQRFIAKGPRAATDPDDDRLWFITDCQTGMPVWNDTGIAWFTRAAAKEHAGHLETHEYGENKSAHG